MTDVGYICAECGYPTPLPDGIDLLDGGTTLECFACGGLTVVDLSTREERTRLFGEAVECDE